MQSWEGKALGKQDGVVSKVNDVSVSWEVILIAHRHPNLFRPKLAESSGKILMSESVLYLWNLDVHYRSSRTCLILPLRFSYLERIPDGDETVVPDG